MAPALLLRTREAGRRYARRLSGVLREPGGSMSGLTSPMDISGLGSATPLRILTWNSKDPLPFTSAYRGSRRGLKQAFPGGRQIEPQARSRARIVLPSAPAGQAHRRVDERCAGGCGIHRGYPWANGGSRLSALIELIELIEWSIPFVLVGNLVFSRGDEH